MIRRILGLICILIGLVMLLSVWDLIKTAIELIDFSNFNFETFSSVINALGIALFTPLILTTVGFIALQRRS